MRAREVALVTIFATVSSGSRGPTPLIDRQQVSAGSPTCLAAVVAID